MLPAMPVRMALMPVCVMPKAFRISANACWAASLFEPPAAMSPMTWPKLMFTVLPVMVMMPCM